jgi:small-conductance mechanosensitive channel
MFTLLLGMDVLISGWITAHLLAVAAAFFLIRTHQFDLAIGWLREKIPNRFFYRNSRWIGYLVMVAFLGTSLTIVMRLEPIQAGILASIFDKPNWSQYYGIFDDVLIAFGILLLITLIPIINRIYSRFSQRINGWRHTRFRVIKIQNLEILTPNQLTNLMILAAKYVRYGVILLVASTCLTLIFSLYPETAGLARAFLDIVNEVLRNLLGKIIAFLPHLVTLFGIILLTRLALNLLRFFYEGLQRGKVRYSALHPELIEPTYQILRFLVVAFALVAAFPYIPGSSSPVFKGLSIFIGFLLSLGSTSLVTNIVSGLVLTYTRGLKIGDRVEIADSMGDVIDRTALVTRVRTIKNEIISIPNAKVMQNQIVNYSTLAADEGLILHTSVTIGYDVPWRQVHQLLMGAAGQTRDILRTPAPFVLQTSLDDYYVSYELNAYTSKPARMAQIYSDLHQHIQDNFASENVEIMSPSYLAVRDGQTPTIPQVSSSNNSQK